MIYLHLTKEHWEERLGWRGMNEMETGRTEKYYWKIKYRPVKQSYERVLCIVLFINCRGFLLDGPLFFLVSVTINRNKEQ